jgi:hypothetical protein
MAKKKSKKKASKRGPASTITVVLPAQISASDRALLEGIADLFKAVDYDITKINFVSANDLSPNTTNDMQTNAQGLLASC